MLTNTAMLFRLLIIVEKTALLIWGEAGVEDLFVVWRALSSCTGNASAYVGASIASEAA